MKIYKDKELIYAATSRCQCGAGFAYFKGSDCWDCSDILTGRAVESGKEGAVMHDGAKPFAFWKIKSENQPSANGRTTRPKGCNNPYYTIKRMADELNGCEYGDEITKEIEESAKENGLVVVFGASDDLMMFCGAIDDEFGTEVFLTNKGIVVSKCHDYNCPYFQKEKDAAKKIDAVWGEGEYSWTYKTDIEHITFDVMEDGEKYCKGIVFKLSRV